MASRRGSTDFSICECVLFQFMYKRSARSGIGGLCGERNLHLLLNLRSSGVSVFFRLVRVLRSLPRGLFGRSFLGATVPQPVPSWTPADRLLRPRSGAIRPTLIKSFDRPAGLLAAPIGITPGASARSRGHIELAGSRRGSLARRRRTDTVTKVEYVFSILWSAMLNFSNLGGGQGNGGNRPERRARARRGMRVGRSAHPCSFSSPSIPL